MYILGLNISHTATAAILKDGQILFAASEERFTRVKGQAGFPQLAINWCLEEAQIQPKQVDLVVVGLKDIMGPLLMVGKQQDSSTANFLHYFSYQLNSIIYRLFFFLPQVLFFYQFGWDLILNISSFLIRPYYQFSICKHLKVSFLKIKFLDHHLAHAYAAYYSFGASKNRRLVITNDGIGDMACGRVHLVKGNHWVKLSSTPNKHSLGWLYYQVTRFLGFVPNNEEYKIMGLAPYADQEKAGYLLQLLEPLVYSAGLSFTGKIPAIFYAAYLKDKLKELRFDLIAQVIQSHTEREVCRQIEAVIKETGVCEVVLGGGVAMNIKVNLKAAKIKKLRKLFICPSAADESTALGACFWGYYLLSQEKGIKCNIKPLANLYLGPQFADLQVANDDRLLVRQLKKKGFEKVAKLLAKGEIIAVFWGRMEFGSRALGNRSILANPTNLNIVKKLNQQVKGRDFWMPFAPTILEEYAALYLVDKKGLESPFMMQGFETTAKAQTDLPAALHPADSSCRPQILKKVDNPNLYQLIKEFSKLTGVGALLNTSFNLHGEPIVCTQQDALLTFKACKLRYLLIGDYLISKKND